MPSSAAIPLTEGASAPAPETKNVPAGCSAPPAWKSSLIQWTLPPAASTRLTTTKASLASWLTR